jgi:hypothetical protein
MIVEFEYPDADGWFDVVAYPSRDDVSVFRAAVTDEHAGKGAVPARSEELDTAKSQLRQRRSRISRPPRRF